MANALGYDLLQNGVVASGDLAQTLGASSITNGGTVTYSIAAATAAWVKDANSALIRITPAAQNSQTFAASITSTKYVVYGIEIDPNGVLSAVKGAETATQLNTGSLIASNSPATTSGKMRIMDIAIRNNAGTYQYGDTTQSGSQGVNWIDRRPWARGIDYAVLVTTGDAGLSAFTVTLVMQHRMECTGLPLLVSACGSAGAGGPPWFVTPRFRIDGADAFVSSTVQGPDTADHPFNISAPLAPSAGSRLIQFYAQGSLADNTIKIRANATNALAWNIRELASQNANNGTA